MQDYNTIDQMNSLEAKRVGKDKSVLSEQRSSGNYSSRQGDAALADAIVKSREDEPA